MYRTHCVAVAEAHPVPPPPVPAPPKGNHPAPPVADVVLVVAYDGETGIPAVQFPGVAVVPPPLDPPGRFTQQVHVVKAVQPAQPPPPFQFAVPAPPAPPVRISLAVPVSVIVPLEKIAYPFGSIDIPVFTVILVV